MARAQLDHPLNWILILFAGALFLVLFITTSISILETNTQTSSLELEEELTNTFKQSVSQAKNTFSITLPFLQTSCVPEQSYTITYENQETTFPNQVITSQTPLYGKTTVVSRELVLARPLVPLTYLLSENTLLLFVDVSLEVREHFSSFPSLETSMQELGSVSLAGYDTVLVLSESSLTGLTLAKQQRQNIFGMQVLLDSSSRVSGNIAYFSYSTQFVPAQTTAFSSKELLLAAVLSGTPERYACALAPLEEKFLFVTALNKERMQRIAQAQSWPQICALNYDMLDTTYALVLDDSSFSLTNIQKVTQFERDIARASHALLSNGCPNTR